ncbi:hypothetical protein XOCgx_3747 [Xanthomonas oryzae pv. oryzicola]|nr:hypothetical protein XOCgx_3747 [Xanthomonas oryzae pv. oryzicola]
MAASMPPTVPPSVRTPRQTVIGDVVEKRADSVVNLLRLALQPLRRHRVRGTLTAPDSWLVAN